MSKLDTDKTKINTIAQTIRKSLSQFDTIYIGYSGGLDSSCLLHMIHSLKDKDSQVIAIHVNHNLIQEASQWAEFCRSQVNRLDNINYHIKKVDVIKRGEGIENAARKARWAAFKSIIRSNKGKSALYLGHHLDDQAETLIMRMLRGAGCAGLKSMEQETLRDGITVMRPLLKITKQDLVAYAESNRIGYINDHSNQELTIDRNYIRHEVMPIIKKRWPDALCMLEQTIEHIDSDWCLLRAQAKSLMLDILERHYGIPAINIDKFNQFCKDTRGLILRVHCIESGWYAPHKRQLTELVRQLEGANGSTKISLIQRQYKMHQYRRWLFIMPIDWFTQEPLIEWHDSNKLPGYVEQPNRLKIKWQPEAIMAFKHKRGDAKVILKNDITPDNKLNRVLKKKCHAEHTPPFIRKATPILQLKDKIYLGSLTALDSN